MTIKQQNGKNGNTSHDQNFKNLILDYPRDSLMFFASKECADLPPDVKITPIRQEQLKDRLGDHFHELDTPLQLKWPDGRREAALMVMEEESETARFSIHRTARYCLHLSELLKINRVIPVVIFLRPGTYTKTLTLEGDRGTYLKFRFISCDLGRIPAKDHINSTNMAARLNLPNMKYPHKSRIEVYAQAREGLLDLEINPEKQLKYSEFIDMYAKMDDADIIRYREEYLPKSKHKEVIMGFHQLAYKEGKMSTIIKLLTLRFKTIPARVKERLESAGEEDINRWTERILYAKTIEDVFK